MINASHGWKDKGTSAESYCVEGPYGISGPLYHVGSSGDDIRIKWIKDDLIEVYNASTGDWWEYEWITNNWSMRDSKCIGRNADF